MENLRERLIRLAYKKKKLRSHLLPLIKQASQGGEALKKVLLEAGIEAKDLIEKNPEKIFQKISHYISDEGLFEAFESGPLKYQDLKVLDYEEDPDHDIINWQVKLLLPWSRATRLLLYALSSDRNLKLAPKLAKNNDFKKLVMDNLRPIKMENPLVFFGLYEQIAENTTAYREPFRLGYGHDGEFTFETDDLKAKWTKQGLVIVMEGVSYGE